MTADELDTAAIRRRLVPPLTGSGQSEFAREVGEALWRLCDALDAARAAGGVQPAPAPGWVVVAVLPRGKYEVRENAEGWAVHIFDEQTAGMLAAGGSTDGAGTAGEAIYPGGGLAFTELRPAAGGTEGARAYPPIPMQLTYREAWRRWRRRRVKASDA